MAILKDLIVQGNSRLIGDTQGSKFIVDGGTSSQFMKADGSLDSTAYSTTDVHVTSVANHYTPTGTATKSASGATGTAGTTVQVVTGVTVDAAGHVTGVVPGAATDTTYESKSAASGGTDVSLVTTGEKYTWNNKGTGSVTSVTIKGTSPIVSSSTSAITTTGTRTISHADSGVTAGTYGESTESSTTLNGGTMSVPSFDVNATGHITKAVSHTLKVPEFISGTQTASTASWTGVTTDSELYNGKTIFYYLPYATPSGGESTLNLTLSDGTTTGAKVVCTTGTTQITTHYAAGSVIQLTYIEATEQWRRADYNSNTDTKVRQTLTTANANRPLLLAYSQNTTTTTNVDNVSYRSNTIYANPSTGTITATNYVGNVNGVEIPSDAVFTDTKVTSVANHYTPTGTATKSASGATGTAGDTVQVVTGVTVDAKGHVTGVVSGAATDSYTKVDSITPASGAVNRFGTCSTAAGTAAKTVSITTGTVTLAAGLIVAVKFTNANTAGTPTLNVASTGAKNIFVNGAQITTGGNKALLKGTVLFIYDGTQYHIIGNYIDTTYSGGTVSDLTSGTSTDNELWSASVINAAIGTGSTTGTSITSVPITNKVAVITLSSGSAGALGLGSGFTVAGRELHIIVKNTGSSDYTITIPHSPSATSGYKYINTITNSTGGTVIVPKNSGGYAEINAICDGTYVYLRYT